MPTYSELVTTDDKGQIVARDPTRYKVTKTNSEIRVDEIQKYESLREKRGNGPDEVQTANYVKTQYRFRPGGKLFEQRENRLVETKTGSGGSITKRAVAPQRVLVFDPETGAQTQEQKYVVTKDKGGSKFKVRTEERFFEQKAQEERRIKEGRNVGESRLNLQRRRFSEAQAKVKTTKQLDVTFSGLGATGREDSIPTLGVKRTPLSATVVSGDVPSLLFEGPKQPFQEIRVVKEGQQSFLSKQFQKRTDFTYFPSTTKRGKFSNEAKIAAFNVALGATQAGKKGVTFIKEDTLKAGVIGVGVVAAGAILGPIAAGSAVVSGGLIAVGGASVALESALIVGAPITKAEKFQRAGESVATAAAFGVGLFAGGKIGARVARATTTTTVTTKTRLRGDVEDFTSTITDKPLFGKPKEVGFLVGRRVAGEAGEVIGVVRGKRVKGFVSEEGALFRAEGQAPEFISTPKATGTVRRVTTAEKAGLETAKRSTTTQFDIESGTTTPLQTTIGKGKGIVTEVRLRTPSKAEQLSGEVDIQFLSKPVTDTALGTASKGVKRFGVVEETLTTKPKTAKNFLEDFTTAAKKAKGAIGSTFEKGKYFLETRKAEKIVDDLTFKLMKLNKKGQQRLTFASETRLKPGTPRVLGGGGRTSAAIASRVFPKTSTPFFVIPKSRASQLSAESSIIGQAQGPKSIQKAADKLNDDIIQTPGTVQQPKLTQTPDQVITPATTQTPGTTLTPGKITTLIPLTPLIPLIPKTPTPPGIGLPAFRGLGGGFGGGRGSRQRKQRQQTRRTPSFTAAAFNITATEAKVGEISGLGLRPIKKRKKKK